MRLAKSGVGFTFAGRRSWVAGRRSEVLVDADRLLRRQQFRRQRDILADVGDGVAGLGDERSALADHVAAALDELTVQSRHSAGDGLHRLEQRVQNRLLQPPRIKVLLLKRDESHSLIRSAGEASAVIAHDDDRLLDDDRLRRRAARQSGRR